MAYDFDTLIDRRASESMKWHRFGDDVLPMWVADMDFRSSEAVITALKERIDHGVFGYPQETPELHHVLVDWIATQYGWRVSAEDLMVIPGVVIGFNLVAHAVVNPGEAVLVQTPAYPPFLAVSKNVGIIQQDTELVRGPDGRYTIDFEAFERTINPQTRAFMLCNPQNPTGRVLSKAELERLAEICLRHKLTICADEIHCDIVYSGNKHIPVASLSPEIAKNTITLIAPSKTFNIAGLQASVAIVPNPELRQKLKAASQGLVFDVNLLGQTAMLAAYKEGLPWLKEALVYLQGNRDYLCNYVRSELPEISIGTPEGTYLAWLDCRKAGIQGNLQKFFVEKGKIALNDGETFGKGGQGFVRLNFGCPRSVLIDGLERIKKALQNR